MLKFIVILSCWSTFSFTQDTYTFEQAEKELKSEKEFLFVFLHTSWCDVCKLMEVTTFKDSLIIQYLNQGYFIPFDVESKKTIHFNDKSFKYKALGSSGIHELADALGKIENELVFPTFVILNKQLEIIFQHAGYLSEKELLMVLEKTLEL